MGRTETKIPVMTVLEAKELFPVNVPAAALVPDFGWLHKGQGNLLGACPVHFFSDDLFGLPQYSLSEWQVGVNPGCQLADHSGSQHETVA